MVFSQQATSNKQQATSNKQQARSVFPLVFTRSITLISVLSSVSLAPLSAEGNGAFMEGGFQYSNFGGVTETSNGASTETYNGSTTVLSPASGSLQKLNGNLYGADIQAGYKQFFGKTKRFGLRYYGFFSGQGGSALYQQQKYNNSDGEAYNTVIHQPAANLFYGVGIDALLNFYDKNNSTFGVFAGVMIGGSSWLMGKGRQDGQCAWATALNNQGNPTNCVTMNDYYDQQAKMNNELAAISGNPTGSKASFSPNYVQFIFNVGFRANLSKHQGFEVGVRIPTIDDPYYTFTMPSTTGSNNGGVSFTTGAYKETLTLRRNIAVYLNYVINF
ncbi:outer membrane protein [Helicobacter suis]|uniref:outer membrane protein n=1 Tax=Helicobacter suis TaxID=104628 RepID=UPI0013CF71C0|nr:outer membrane protein [Helicobacter suis]